MYFFHKRAARLFHDCPVGRNVLQDHKWSLISSCATLFGQSYWSQQVRRVRCVLREDGASAACSAGLMEEWWGRRKQSGRQVQVEIIRGRARNGKKTKRREIQWAWNRIWLHNPGSEGFPAYTGLFRLVPVQHHMTVLNQQHQSTSSQRQPQINSWAVLLCRGLMMCIIILFFLFFFFAVIVAFFLYWRITAECLFFSLGWKNCKKLLILRSDLMRESRPCCPLLPSPCVTYQQYQMSPRRRCSITSLSPFILSLFVESLLACSPASLLQRLYSHASNTRLHTRHQHISAACRFPAALLSPPGEWQSQDAGPFPWAVHCSVLASRWHQRPTSLSPMKRSLVLEKTGFRWVT